MNTSDAAFTSVEVSSEVRYRDPFLLGTERLFHTSGESDGSGRVKLPSSLSSPSYNSPCRPSCCTQWLIFGYGPAPLRCVIFMLQVASLQP